MRFFPSYFTTTLLVITLTSCSIIKQDGLVEQEPTESVPTIVGSADSVSESESIEIFEEISEAVPALVEDSPLENEIAPPSQPTHLLADLSEGFSWETHAHRNEVLKEIRRHQKQPEYFYEVLMRSAPFLALIVEKLDEQQMPRELALLPFIESGYDPSIFSSSNAGGLWQFIPSTARYLGMHMDWWYDERLDIELSTDKALDYLSYLHGRFDNNWELALAAYNGGEGHVSSRIKQSGGKLNFWEINLKNETSSYVPKLLAVVELISEPEQYGIELPEIPLGNPLKSVEFENQIDLRLASKTVGMKYEDIQTLNAGYLRWISPPSKTHKLLIPEDRHQDFLAALKEITTDEQLAWNHYRVRRGDSLSEIANNFGTTLKALVAVNQLENSTIYVNQDLLIPTSELPLTRFASQSNTVKQLYVVKQGDSLWEISRDQGVAIGQIRRLNSFSGNHIKPGQVLVLAETFTGGEITYMVRQGDSLSQIASRFQVAVADIRAWNELNGDLIKPGQALRIRTNGSS